MSKFKIGDVVKVIKNDSYSSNKVGDVGTVTEIRGYSNIKVTVNGKKDFGNFHYPHDLEHFGPVRETTVVKKEIIPGTYGDVRVSAAPKRIYVDVVQQKTKLTEVIKTLQIIHDALE